MRERRETRGGAVRRPRAKAERSEPKRREVNDMSEPTGMNVVRHEAGTSGVHLPTSVTRRSYRESSPFPPLPVIYPPPVSAAVPPSLKASSHGVNDGWRKRKETTHGESERETGWTGYERDEGSDMSFISFPFPSEPRAKDVRSERLRRDGMEREVMKDMERTEVSNERRKRSQERETRRECDEVSGGPLPSYFGRREPGPRAATSSSTRLSFSSFIPWLVPLACGAYGWSEWTVWMNDRQTQGGSDEGRKDI